MTNKAKIFFVFILLFVVFNKVKATEFLPIDTFIVYISDTTLFSSIITDKEILQSIEKPESRINISELLAANDTSKRNKFTLVIVTLLTGPLGGHRLYLGTKPIVPIVYACTLGCAGILPFIDLIVICFSKDISRFENNDKIIMWAK